jgi:hypothetical protein
VDPFELVKVLPDDAIAPLVLSVRLEDAAGERIDSSWYAFNAHPKSERVRELEALPLEELEKMPVADVLRSYAEVGSAPLKEQPRTRLAADREGRGLRISNVGAVPAPIVIVDGFPHGPGRWLEDNAFGLDAGESRLVRFDASDADPSGITVRAWNASSVRPG